MQINKEAVRLGRVLDTWRQLEFLATILLFVTSWFTIGIVSFLRRDFGERFLSWPNLFFGYAVVANFTFLGTLIAVGTGSGFSPVMLLFWLAFIALSLYHRLQISRKNRAGIPWHSFYPGESLLRLPYGEEIIHKWVEPGLIFVAGLLFWKLVPVVGIWLFISALSLLLHSHLVYYYQRQAFLDARDAQIEARNMSQALSGRPARETAGFAIAESNLELMRKDPGLREAFATLGSDMKDVLDAPPAVDQELSEVTA